jgi:hypothetical protein
MSIKPQTNICSQIKGFDELRKKFDIVEIDESHEKYNILTCKDIVKRTSSIINYSIWLQLKINKSHQNSNSYISGKDTKEYLESCIKEINDWSEKLINFEDKNQQLSLFDELNKVELEPEPESPKGGEDNAWNSYFRKQEKARKNNLMKQYSFFELFNDHSSFWLYKDIDFRRFLPSYNETINLIKNLIIKYKNNPGRYEDGWFDDKYKWITRDGALSDIELFKRVMFQVRLYLVPYKRFFHVSLDDSYSKFIIEESISYRFYLSKGEFVYWGSNDFDKYDLPKYDFYNKEFIEWLRETFNVPFKEIDSDDEVLEDALKQFFNGYLWYGKEEYNWQERIKNFKDWKAFKNDLFNFKKERSIDNNGGSSLCVNDGYRGSLCFDRNSYGLEIFQKNIIRKQLNRDIKPSHNDDESLVFKINGDDIFKKAFELFSSNTKQLTLLDFL